MLIPERGPTQAEQKKWDDFVTRAEKVKRLTFANVLRAENAKIISAFAARRGLTLPTVSPVDQKRLVAVVAEFARIQRGIQAVERLELCVKFQNGEIDIMAPPWYTKEQIASYNLSGWFVPIIIGIAALAGLIGRLYDIEQENTELAAKYDAVLKASEKRICDNPNSAECQEWQKEKEPTGYVKNVGVIDQIAGSISDFGKTAKKGIGIGLAIAVPLLAWSYLRQK
jgi:hypothetical protein